MRRRGLPDPLLVASDGAPGMIRAVEECLPRSVRQRCLAHKMRNLQSKVPADVWPEFKARAAACYQAASPALARLLRDEGRETVGPGRFDQQPPCRAGREPSSEPGTKRMICTTLMSAFPSSRRVNLWLS